ncbi:MAG: VF530 family protein [Desulfuromusa sp.]|nr:VF530 family protein [Desulfuromusa sp.]
MTERKSNDPLHGITLENIINSLVDYYDWEELGQLIDIRCFNSNPSVKSSLKFLRRTPWARKQVEDLYLAMKREIGKENRGVFLSSRDRVNSGL